MQSSAQHLQAASLKTYRQLPKRPPLALACSLRQRAPMNQCRLLILIFTITLGAQSARGGGDHNASLWLNYFGDHPIQNSPWQIHLDTQIRRADYGRQWQQFLIQPGINYEINDRVKLGLGYGYMETDPYGDHPVPFELPEHRIYEQISVDTPLWGQNWQHRFRWEQRFLGTPTSLTATDYRFRFENRFRYRLQTIMSMRCLGGSEIYLRLYDEVFVNVGSDVAHNHFDQNRAYIGIGKRIRKHIKCEFGFMEQTLQQRSGSVWENNHTLIFSLSSGQPAGNEF